MMNSFTSSVPVILVLSALSGAAVAADAVSPAVSAQAASTSTALPAAKGVPVSPTAAAKPGASSSDPAVRKLFCLNMSLRCFAMKAPPASGGTPKAAPLDLHAPDIHRIIPEVQLREPVDEPQEVAEQQEQNQVQVQGSRPEIDLPIGIASLPWAVMHPTQAWRIFLPVPPGTAK